MIIYFCKKNYFLLFFTKVFIVVSAHHAEFSSPLYLKVVLYEK